MKERFLTSKSFKYLRNKLENERDLTYKPVRTSAEQKIDLLKTAVYDKKSRRKRSFKHLVVQQAQTCESEHRDGLQIIKRFNNNYSHLDQSNYRYSALKQNHQVRKRVKKSIIEEYIKKDKKKQIVGIIKIEQQIQKQLFQSHERSKSVFNPGQSQQKIHFSASSQSLLKKSSLYLFSHIKRKSRNKEEEDLRPHVAGIPNVASHMTISSPCKRRAVSSIKMGKGGSQKKNNTSFKACNSFLIEPW